MALTKRKPAKKRPAPKKKRKASPAQLAALARGRAKRKAKTGSTKKRKVSKKSSLPVKQERKTMARKKRTATTTKKRSVRRVARGIGGKVKGMMPMIKDVGIAVAGGVGANVLANKFPIANPKIKAALPLIAGILVSSVLGKKKAIFREIGTGMAVIGGLALLKQFAPNIPMLAGEDDTVYLPPGYGGDMMQLGYDDDGDGDYMGDMLQLGDDQEQYMSPASM